MKTTCHNPAPRGNDAFDAIELDLFARALDTVVVLDWVDTFRRRGETHRNWTGCVVDLPKVAHGVEA